jgi:Holliday junction resolvase RusA-like endonuclease
MGISLTAIVQVKSEAHDKELYQQFKQDIDNEVANMRDLLRQHITLSDREEQLKLVLLILIFSFYFLRFIL